MKNLIKILTIAIVLVITSSLSSCNKQGEKPESQLINPTKDVESNHSNIYDNVGYIHNCLIDRILEDFNDEETLEDMILLTESVLDDNSMDTIGLGCLIKYICTEDNINSFYYDVINNSDLSNIGKRMLSGLYSDIVDLVESQCTTYSTFRDLIVGYEDDIMGNNYISSDEKEVLLSATSVFRYSLYYWSQNDNDNSKLPRWAKYAILAGADAIGAVVGAHIGAITQCAIGASAGVVMIMRLFNVSGFEFGPMN